MVEFFNMFVLVGICNFSSGSRTVGITDMVETQFSYNIYASSYTKLSVNSKNARKQEKVVWKMFYIFH